MRPIGLEDVLGRERYGRSRDAIRRRLIEHKRLRRVDVGERLSLLFEDRATVWYQTQEMLWVEQITDLDAIREELRVYNQLLPREGDLAATLLIQIRDQARMRAELRQMIGLDRHLFLRVGDRRIPAVFEEGRQTEDKISAVQYVRFPLDTAARDALRGEAALGVECDHPANAAVVTLDAAGRGAILDGVFDAAVADAALRRVREGTT